MRGPDIEKLYSPGDVAKMLNVTVKTLRNYVHRGILKPDIVKTTKGGCVRYKFKEATVTEFLKSCNRGEPITEDVLYIGEVAKMCGVRSKTLLNYVEVGILVPDVVLPNRGNGHSGWAKFTRSHAEDFVERYQRGEFRGELTKRKRALQCG